jgi:methionine-rich copper-binding protein CopC
MKIGKTQAFIAGFTLSLFSLIPAHANSLVATSPISGSTTTTAPTSVAVTAQVALLEEGNEITVVDPAGNRVDDGTITVDQMSVSVGLRALVDAGIYKVSYILLTDGEDPLEGSFTFNFSSPNVIEPAPEPAPTQSPQSASSSWGTNVFVIALLVLAFLVLVGLSLYARKLFKNR